MRGGTHKMRHAKTFTNNYVLSIAPFGMSICGPQRVKCAYDHRRTPRSANRKTSGFSGESAVADCGCAEPGGVDKGTSGVNKGTKAVNERTKAVNKEISAICERARSVKLIFSAWTLVFVTRFLSFWPQPSSERPVQKSYRYSSTAAANQMPAQSLPVAHVR
jgi:hypothetical protein